MSTGDEEQPDQTMISGDPALATDGEGTRQVVRRKPPRRVYVTVLGLGLILAVAGPVVGSWQVFLCGLGVVTLVATARVSEDGAGPVATVIAAVMVLLFAGLVVSGAMWGNQTDSTAARDEFVAWCPVSCTPGAAGNQTAMLCRSVLDKGMSCSDLATFNCNASLAVFIRCRALVSAAQDEERHSDVHVVFLFIGHMMAIAVVLLALALFLYSLEGEARVWHWLAGRLPFTTRCVRALGVDVSHV